MQKQVKELNDLQSKFRLAKDGKDGRDGINGLDGKDGLPGVPGPVGERGPAGESIPGPKGEVGAQGPRGEKGDKGDPGKDGHSPVVDFGTGEDFDRLSIDGRVRGPHLTGPSGMNVQTAGISWSGGGGGSSSSSFTQVNADWNTVTTSDASYILNKPSIPAAQIQADWAQVTTTALDYIKNKPATLPATWLGMQVMN